MTRKEDYTEVIINGTVYYLHNEDVLEVKNEYLFTAEKLGFKDSVVEMSNRWHMEKEERENAGWLKDNEFNYSYDQGFMYSYDRFNVDEINDGVNDGVSWSGFKSDEVIDFVYKTIIKQSEKDKLEQAKKDYLENAKP